MKYLNKVLWSLAVVTLLISCYDKNDYYYTANDVFESLKVELTVDSIFADGNSALSVKYKFPLYTDTTLSKLTLQLSNGTFLKSKSDKLVTNFSRIDSIRENRIVEAIIVSSTSAGNCYLTTQLQQYEKIDTIRFIKAFPTKVSLSVDPFYIKNDTVVEVAIVATVNSSGGIASKGTPVNLSYSPAEVGILNQSTLTTAADGKASFKFVFTKFDFSGDIIINAETLNEAGDLISVYQVLRVID